MPTLKFPNGTTIEFDECEERLLGMEAPLLLVQPEGPEDEETAKLLQGHANWLLNKKVDEAIARVGPSAEELTRGTDPAARFVIAHMMGWLDEDEG